MMTEPAFSGYVPAPQPDPTLPESTFAAELALWRQVAQERDAVHVLAAAYGVGSIMGTISRRAVSQHWRNAPKWLQRLALEPNPTALAAGLAVLGLPSSSVFDAFERFEHLRPVAAPVSVLLLADGDPRSALSPVSGLNRYGCAPLNQPGTVSFSACSGNEIGRVGLAAAGQLRQRLMYAAWNDNLAADLSDCDRDQKSRIVSILGIPIGTSDGMALTESGTGAIRLVAKHLTAGPGPYLFLVVGPKETGREVPDAVCVGPHVAVEAVDIRQDDTGDAIDSASLILSLEAKIAQAQEQGKQVILQVVEGSKTGLVAPGIEGVRALLARFPKDLTIVADFCQMRPGTSALAYWQMGASIVATGSKFLGGPVFSGVALIPNGGKMPMTSVGTALRWEAALSECGGYAHLSQQQVEDGLQAFARTVVQACEQKPGLVPVKDDNPAHIMTLHLEDDQGRLLHMENLKSLLGWLVTDATALLPATAKASEHALASRRCLIGQPVMVGNRPAIRLAINAGRLTSVVQDPDGRARLASDIGIVLGKIDLIRRCGLE